MKRYIKKILICIIVPIFFLLLAIFGFVQLEPLPKIKTDISKAFVGDSHFFSINDSLIPQSISISSGSESYYYSFYKLKKFLAISRKVIFAIKPLPSLFFLISNKAIFIIAVFVW